MLVLSKDADEDDEDDDGTATEEKVAPPMGR